MVMNGTCFCIKCNKGIDWQYATPEEIKRIDLTKPNSTIASTKLVDSQREEYEIEFKCPHCNTVNKTEMRLKNEMEEKIQY